MHVDEMLKTNLSIKEEDVSEAAKEHMQGKKKAESICN